MRKKLTDKIAIEIMKDINDGVMKTSAICTKYQMHDLKPHDIYNIIHKEHYKHLRELV